MLPILNLIKQTLRAKLTSIPQIITVLNKTLNCIHGARLDNKKVFWLSFSLGMSVLLTKFDVFRGTF